MFSLFFNKKKSDSPTRNFTVGFYDIFQKYYTTLKEIYLRKSVPFEEASKLELFLYLLFRADFLLQKSSLKEIRQLYFKENLRQIKPDMPEELLSLCYLRLDIYGQLYSDIKNKEGNVFSIEFLDSSYDWLISAINLCKDDYKLMAKKKYIPMPSGLWSNYSIKVCLQELDISYAKKFIEEINGIVEIANDMAKNRGNR